MSLLNTSVRVYKAEEIAAMSSAFAGVDPVLWVCGAGHRFNDVLGATLARLVSVWLCAKRLSGHCHCETLNLIQKMQNVGTHTHTPAECTLCARLGFGGVG